MTVSAADLADMRMHVDAIPHAEMQDLSALETIPEVLGYIIASARQDGEDEANAIEMMVRLAGMTPGEVRQHERILRPLGYIAVCDRLRQIAGRRTASLVPPG